MIFSSPIFLFCFLPIVLTFYFLIPKFGKNFYLLITSFFFYYWAERALVWIMILSIIINYFAALGLAHFAQNKHSLFYKKLLFTLTIIFNLGLLLSFKYLSFFINNFNYPLLIFGFAQIPTIFLPLAIGISFYTFHAISYVIDVYKGVSPQKNIINFALYIVFFPQLIAGPIIRYHTICDQFTKRLVTSELFIEGIQRFIVGLAKKILIANTLALQVDIIFATSPDSLNPAVAWFGILCYTLQIYFDFSGYSDMAIGIARMFGFRFPENFNYPYSSLSVTDFWRRWHISLSSWFKDYVFIPLGGSRKGASRNYINLFIVFLLCGFWHGASWLFIFWGAWYAFFLVLEKWILLRFLSYLWRPYRYIYTMFVIIVGWVFFRSPDFGFAINYLKSMFGMQRIGSNYLFFDIKNEVLLALFFGIIFSFPVYKFIRERFKYISLPLSYSLVIQFILSLIYGVILVLLFYLSVMALAINTYNPFIYFRF